MKTITKQDGKLFRHLQRTTGLYDVTQFDITVKERNIVIKSDKNVGFYPKWTFSNFATKKLFGIKKKDFKFDNKKVENQ